MNKDKFNERIKEIKELYDISESETVLLNQMQILIQMLGYSSNLTLKLLRALTAMFEVVCEK